MTARTPDDLTRRTVLGQTALTALGATVWPAAVARKLLRPGAPGSTGDRLIVVFARGGYDALNMIVPFGEGANYYDRRKNIAIPAPDSADARRCADLDGFFGMHPTLVDAGWKQWYDEGILAIVHAAHMDDPTRSHFDAMDFMERGAPGDASVRTGWIARHLATMATGNGSPFRGVGVGALLQVALRGPVGAVVLQSIADFRLQARQSEVDRFQVHLERLHATDGWLDRQGRTTFAAVDLLAREVGSGTYVPSNGATYPTSAFGQGMAQVAQLAKADVGLEIACVDIGGWDTHSNETSATDPTTGTLANLMDDLARSISALVTDVHPAFDPADNATPGITIVVMSEFGRRADENGALGTDHGHGSVLFVFGKGINGGKVYANPWPGLADDQLDARGDLAGTTEYRDVLGEILARRLGSRAIDQVFPDHAFNFLDLARPLDVVVPTATTPPTPGPTPATPAPPGEIFIPSVRRRS